jgi:hypothetical protein
MLKKVHNHLNNNLFIKMRHKVNLLFLPTYFFLLPYEINSHNYEQNNEVNPKINSGLMSFPSLFSWTIKAAAAAVEVGQLENYVSV